MSRVLRTIVFILFLLSTVVFANNTNDVMAKAAVGFVNSFSSVFIPILILGAIITIGLSMVQKKSEVVAYGCGIILLIALALVIIAFIKAHSNFFIIAGFIVLVVVKGCARKYFVDGDL